jgi:hypothetical protein
MGFAQIMPKKEEPISIKPEEYKTLPKNVSKQLYKLYIELTNPILQKFEKEYGKLAPHKLKEIEEIIEENSMPPGF